MTIKELICREKHGNVKTISEYNQSMLQSMIGQMNNPRVLIPSQFYRDWIKGDDSFINKLSVSLLKDLSLIHI